MENFPVGIGATKVGSTESICFGEWEWPGIALGDVN